MHPLAPALLICERPDVLHFIHMGHTITIRIDRELADWLERESATTGMSQGRIVRDQLQKARTGGTERPFMRLAGTVRRPPDLSRRKGFSRS